MYLKQKQMEEITILINRIEENSDLSITRDYLTIEQAMEMLGINNKTRKHEIVAKRFLFWRYLHDNGYNLTRIGRITGHDHASVIHGLERLRNKFMRDYYNSFKSEVDAVAKQVKFN